MTGVFNPQYALSDVVTSNTSLPGITRAGSMGMISASREDPDLGTPNENC